MHIRMGGKLIFSGEYSLLHGGLGISACFDEAIRFHIQEDTAQSTDVTLCSDRYGTASFNLEDNVKPEFALFQKVLTQLDLKKLSITIETETDFQGGFGSSGACIVALCCYAHKERTTSENFKAQLLETSVSILRTISQKASGMDMASEIYGKVVLYDPKQIKATALNTALLDQYRMVAVDCGYKTPTARCLDIINEKHSPDAQQEIFAQISNCTKHIYQAIENADSSAFETWMQKNNQLLIQLGVCDDTLFDILAALSRNGSRIAKISGSGLGDCILAFFDTDKDLAFLQTDPLLKNFKSKALVFNRTGVEVYA